LEGAYIYIDESLKGSELIVNNEQPLVINKSITIEGNGIILSGNETARIMDIVAGNDVTVSTVHFTKGIANDEGAAIRNKSQKLTLLTCIFSNNRTRFQSAYGGAVYSEGDVSAVGCTFYNNLSGYKGGVFYLAGRANIDYQGNLFYQNNFVEGGSLSGSGPDIYVSLGNAASKGYNVYHKDGFPSVFSDVSYTGTVALVNEDGSTNASFEEWKDVFNIVPSEISGFPAVDFFGQARIHNNRMTAGAMTLFEVSVTAEETGSISPAGNIGLPYCGRTFTITANDVYELLDVLVNNQSVKDEVTGNGYTLSGLTNDCTIFVRFQEYTSIKKVTVEGEVKEISYYNVSGIEVPANSWGVLIRKTVYENGTMRVEKLKRQRNGK
jgi:hypothetical protein